MRGVALPARVYLHSPWLDLGLSGESYRDRAIDDGFTGRHGQRHEWLHTVFAKHYVGENDPREAEMSPLFADLRGFKATRLGYRHRSERVVEARDPKGRRIYWVGAAGQGQDAGPGTDFHAISEGYIALTPIHVDLTRYQALESVSSWAEGLAPAQASA
jgi:hypothetical protein